MDYELEIGRLQETMRMSAGLHSQHSENMLENLQLEDDSLQARIVENERQMELHNQRMAQVDLRPAEIGDKLDGLIGFVDRNSRGPKTGGPI